MSAERGIPLPLVPRWLPWGGVGAVCALIFYGSIVTVPETVVDDAQPVLIDLNYWRHLVAYGVLALSLAYASDHWELGRWRHAVVVIGMAAGYGVVMELGQVFVPHRTDFMMIDVFVNAIGASVVVVWFLLRPHLSLLAVEEWWGAVGRILRR